jgi:hypothetical protein
MLFREWSAHPSDSLAVEQGSLIALCVETVIDELGEDDFETRVGASIDEARELLLFLSDGRSRDSG